MSSNTTTLTIVQALLTDFGLLFQTNETMYRKCLIKFTEEKKNNRRFKDRANVAKIYFSRKVADLAFKVRPGFYTSR